MLSRLHLALVGTLLGALALAAFVADGSRAEAQAPAICSADLYLAIAPPTLSVTATPAIIDANSGTSVIEARPLNALGDPPQAGCEVELSTNLGSFASTGGSSAIVQTDVQGVATDIFQCDGVVGTATITALISLVLPNFIGPTMTATTLVECTASGVPDLSMAKSHAPDPFEFGGQGQFMLTVTNNGPGPASGFIIFDSLPPGFTFVSDSDGDWVCSANGQDVTCTYVGPPLAAGQSATVILTVAVGNPSDFTGGPVLNPVSIDVDNCATVQQLTAVVGTFAVDPDPSNDTACDRIVMEGVPAAQPIVFPKPAAVGGLVVGFSGTDDVQALADAQVFEVLSISMFDNSMGKFLIWINGAPAAVNTLTTLCADDIVFIKAAG